MAHERHYRAFISYSHADRDVAQWLHRALESYRIPSRLVGQTTDAGIVPARLAPIFRDRDELSAAGSLSDTLRTALQHSEYLVVIASPAAAASHWVNEETRLFKQMHGEERVLALIANGEAGGRGSAGAFPPALRFHVDADGTITDRRAEPIAADIRPGKDGRRLAKLKIVAGLTGLPLDALVQREAQRRQRWLAGIATASLALVAAMAVLTVLAIQGQREAERQRAEADGLIEFMLTDLRRKLEPVGRLDVLDSVGQRAMAYYAAQKLARLDPDALGRRARALMLVGEVRDLRGNTDDALAAYRQAEASTAELLARDPDNAERLFDHAQSVFYVGQLAWQRRDWATAEDRFRTYDRLAARMEASDPTNERWLMERSYAHQSLGALYRETARFAEAEEQFRKALRYSEALAAAQPDDPDRAWAVGQDLGWLADALRGQGRLKEAAASREAELERYDGVLARDPQNARGLLSKGVALDALAEIRLLAGDVPAALAKAEAADSVLERLHRADPANMLWLEVATKAATLKTELLLIAGDIDAAVVAGQRANVLAARHAARDPGSPAGRMMVTRADTIGYALYRARNDASGASRAAARLLAIDPATLSPSNVPYILMVRAAEMRAAGAGERAEAHRRLALALAKPPRSARTAAWIAIIAPAEADPSASTAYPAALLLQRMEAG